MNKDKPTFILIVCLLVIFLPLSIMGIYYRLTKVENPNKEFLYEGSLYFYTSGELTGKYECISSDCGYAGGSLEALDINYYVGNDTYEIFNSSYVFIRDDGKTMLYDLNSSRPLVEYEEIKYYNTFSQNNVILTKLNGKWGLFSTSLFKSLIPNNYDYLSIADNMVDNVLQDDILLANNGEQYFLIDSSNSILSELFNNLIVDYNSKYILTDEYKLYSYEKDSYLDDVNIVDGFITSNRVLVVNEDNKLLIYSDVTNKYDLEVELVSYETINIKEVNNSIEIYLDSVLHETIEIN